MCGNEWDILLHVVIKQAKDLRINIWKQYDFGFTFSSTILENLPKVGRPSTDGILVNLSTLR